jgi:V8-like Glu-specific endopeptidase
MEWNENYTSLSYILAGLYRQNKGEAYAVAEKATINTLLISDLEAGNIYTFWHFLIRGAIAQGKVISLVSTILLPNEKGGAADPSIRQTIEGILENIKTGTVPASQRDNSSAPPALNEKAEGFERLMGEKSTLLPLSFLEKGLDCARSVVRILVTSKNETASGTGFLIKNNWIVTNNHVLPDPKAAAGATIQFNYQKNMAGLFMPIEEFALKDSDRDFYTNTLDDWTVVKLDGEANKNFGALNFSAVPVIEKDFVNIIQHPSGGPKQIAMYHNTVTSVDDQYIMYLTDTLPGSSGSPVFNTDWLVVGLHHWGGPEADGSGIRNVFRNRGINITRITKALTDLKIL